MTPKEAKQQLAEAADAVQQLADAQEQETLTATEDIRQAFGDCVDTVTTMNALKMAILSLSARIETLEAETLEAEPPTKKKA